MSNRFRILLGFLLVFVSALGWCQPAEPTVTGELEVAKAAPGSVIKGSLKVVFAPGLHAYQNPQTDETIIPISVTADEGVTLESVSYPKGSAKVIPAISPDPYFLHEGTINIPFTVKIPEKLGPNGIGLVFSYQQCNDQNCFPPGRIQLSLPFTVDPTAEKITATVDNGAKGSVDAGEAPPAEKATGLGGWIQEQFQNKNYFLLVLGLFVIGLSINLTPCVYPLIPVTLSFFANQSKDDPNAKKAVLGFAYMIGIAITYGLVGGIAAAAGGFFGQLFINPWFNLALGILMVGLALSMFDLYQIGLPPFISKQLKGRSGAIGALIMGLLLGFGAAPCAGPVIVLLFTEVAKLKNAAASVGAFTLVGLGLGFPYMLLAMATGGSKALPKAGSWMKAVKAGMGILVLYFALDYILRGLPNLSSSVAPSTIWAAFFGLSALTLHLFGRNEKDNRYHMVNGALVFVLGGLMGMQLAQGTKAGSAEKAEGLAWKKFDDASWEAAKSSNKPILIDASADWCAECKVIERTVFDTPKAKELTKDVELLKIDWSTGVDQAYIDATRKQFGIQGLPHIVITKPGGEIVEVRNDLKSVEELEEALKKSR